MKVGIRQSGIPNPILEERTKCALDYALCKLRESDVSPYIKHVYLYGSCARKQQTYTSDVDLLVEFSEDIDIQRYRSSILRLRGTISPVAFHLPEVDMHTVVGEYWKTDKLLYYQNVKKEGIDVW